MVIVVLNPISRMMMVENEFTTPFGIALKVRVSSDPQKIHVLLTLQIH